MNTNGSIHNQLDKFIKKQNDNNINERFFHEGMNKINEQMNKQMNEHT